MNTMRRYVRAVAMIVTAQLLVVPPTSGSDCPARVGRWMGGPTRAVAIAGDLAFHGRGAALVVADISDRTSPQPIGEIELPAGAEAIEVDGGLVFVADGQAGLRIIDAADPTAPVEIGSIETGGSGEGIAVRGGYVYFADGLSGVRVIDATDPTAPTEVARLDTPGRATDVALLGDHAFVADGPYSGTGLRVIDVSDPTSPVEIGALASPGQARRITVAGVHAYLADGPGGLRVIDVGDPTAPVEVGSFSAIYATDVEVVGTLAFVAGGAGLSVIHVGTGSWLSQLASLSIPGGATDIALSGDEVIVASNRHGMRVIDVSTPRVPVEMGCCEAEGNVSVMAFDGDLAFVAQQGADLLVFDVRDPTDPVEVGRIGLSDVRAMAAAGDHLLVAIDGECLLWLIDTSDATAPIVVGIQEIDRMVLDLAVTDGHVYMTSIDALFSPFSSLLVVDIRTPSAPVEVAHVSFEGEFEAAGFAIMGNYLIVVDRGGHDDGLRVFDIGTPASPVRVGSFAGSLEATDIAVSGARAVVADNDLGMLVFDLGDPTAPQQLRSFPALGSFGRVALAGRLAAYVTDRLWVVDVSDVTPSLVSVMDPPASITGVAAAGGFLFVAQEDAGFQILELRNCAGYVTPSPSPRAPGGRVAP